jgi:hypothetical protein
MSDIALAVVASMVFVAVIIVAVVVNRRSTKNVPVDEARLREVQAEWRGPEELLFRSTPREVRYTGTARALLTLVAVAGVAALVFAIFLVPAVLRDQQSLSLLEREGVQASGTITRQWTTRNKSNTNYHVAYTYEVDGRGYASAAEVSKGSQARVGVGGAVGLRYLPSRPEFSRLDASVDSPPWIKLVIFLPASLLLAVPWRFARIKNLLAWGIPVGAVVTRNAPTKGGRAIRYAFLDPSGQVVTAHEVVKSRDAPAAGDVITIVCDPNKPRRAGRFPFNLVTLDH